VTTAPWNSAGRTVNPQAVLPQPPPSLPAWARILYYVIETAIVTYAATQYDYGAEIPAVGGDAADPTAGSWRRWVFHWANNSTLDAADDQAFTIDIVNITDGHLDGTWNDADYDYVSGILGGLASNIGPHVVTSLTCTELKAYITGYNPYTNSKPFAHSGAPDRVYPMAVQGGGGALMPPQACSTITEETPSRAHWGRFYTPTLGSASYASTGHLATAVVDALAQAAHDAYETLAQNQFLPVVATTTSGGSAGVPGKPTRVLSGVTGIRVDNVGDVMRSRRLKNYTHRVVLPVPTAQTLPADAA